MSHALPVFTLIDAQYLRNVALALPGSRMAKNTPHQILAFSKKNSSLEFPIPFPLTEILTYL